MSLFSWFSRKPAPTKPRPNAASETSGLLNADATVPLAAGRQGKPMLDPLPPEHAANRKNERMERRELLYTVVRDAMVRAGVLSASYKFKVLSLDQRGRQFLVMMDLAREYGGETVRLSEIEALIAQTAKTRYDILVTAVYWRINDHVAVGIPQKGIAPLGAALPLGTQQAPAAAVRRPLPPVSAPAPLTATPAAPLSRPAPLRPAAPVATAPAPLTGTIAPRPPAPVDYEATRPVPRFEPIEADEVAAFKRALADAAGTNPAPVVPARPGGAPVRSGPIRPRPPNATGFEDTEMPGAEERGPDLSSTQYGELR
ncbi:MULTISPECIES: hypothetical protein [unclassified Acidovorax]|uniref:hypothetical protein n=1 Tax=unclassified Acidovorax TaxID=2684926 RepID=UPI00070F8E82|nr:MULTISPECIES: hypothetical protein [unclassified Acidovorax]KRC27087.1 hypothetical protein ASE31_16780 [Acidovorax sp. Root217]KRC29049.1 hypothetical protein ASE28_19165 [Acidovorax sp. Root219]